MGIKNLWMYLVRIICERGDAFVSVSVRPADISRGIAPALYHSLEIPQEGLIMKKLSQNDKILEHLKRCRSITTLSAVELYGIYRLSARIFDLRQMGYQIDGQPIEVTNRYGEKCHPFEYILLSEPEDAA